MNIKELILQESLKLFNEQGFEVTSARKIARTLNISQGNLRYHFSTKEVIGQQLFDQFYQNYQQIIQELSNDNTSATISKLLDVYHKLFVLYCNYRFILQDLWSLTRSIPAVKLKLQKDYQNRRTAFLGILNRLVENNYLESINQPYLFKRIIYLQIFVGDFWIPHSGIYFDQELSSEVKYYLEHWVLPLLPYLTKKGLIDLQEYYKKHPDLVFPEFEQLILYHLDKTY